MIICTRIEDGFSEGEASRKEAGGRSYLSFPAPSSPISQSSLTLHHTFSASEGLSRTGDTNVALVLGEAHAQKTTASVGLERGSLVAG